MKSTQLTTGSPEETKALGSKLGRLLWPDSVVLVSGDLGAGKTVLAQGIGAGLGLTERVTSPTFTIIQEHSSGRLPLFHADLYRVGFPEELEEIGFEEYYRRGGVLLVEWPQRLGEELWPEEYLEVELEQLGPKERRLTLTAVGEKYEELVDNLASGSVVYEGGRQ
ncbi:MAG: tRNA (adenosine(37)-N6)-threonylcarbamoyltransferase complex ATPase subunit type 1 TsaE [Firmicutes bacterium]|nr:tRNA (adenosine(37)-N6)-threonylcarbamoyltransferase complex ATPase subunit type 1 TsaE [Bacillota bacterium]